MSPIIFVQLFNERVLRGILHLAINGCCHFQAKGVRLATKGFDNFTSNEFGGIQSGELNLTLKDFCRDRLALRFSSTASE